MYAQGQSNLYKVWPGFCSHRNKKLITDKKTEIQTAKLETKWSCSTFLSISLLKSLFHSSSEPESIKLNAGISIFSEIFQFSCFLLLLDQNISGTTLLIKL